MKILLTGATGFIGKHIYAKLLESNVALHMISRKPQEHLKNCQVLDILNLKYSYTLIKNLKPDTLIHLAWDVSHGDFWNSEKNNDYAQATIHLFETFIKYGGNKIISTGSCAEYPTSCQAVSENQDYEGTLTAYGTAKKQVATYLESKKKYIDFTWCRIFGIFGPGENSKRLFPSIISSIKEKKSFPIDTPEVFYDYVYIKTFAKLILSCINKKGMGIVNIGTGNSLSIFDIYQTIKHYISDKAWETFNTYPQPGETSRIPNCQKLKHHGYHLSLDNDLMNHIYSISSLRDCLSGTSILTNYRNCF